MRKCIADIWAGLGFLALAVAFGVQLGGLEGVSRVFPQSLAILIALGGVYFILKGGMALLREKAATHEQDEGPCWPRIGLMTVLAVAYALGIQWLGFFTSTALFLFLAFQVLTDNSTAQPKRFFYGLLFAVLFCLLIWLGFVKLLNVPTPEGLFI